MKILEKFVSLLFVFSIMAMTSGVAEAQSCKRFPDQPKCQADPGPTPDPGPGPDPLSWMHPDVSVAHELFTGVGSHMITVDNFSGTTYNGNLNGTPQNLTHGEWTFLESQLVAPGASRTAISNSASGSIGASYSATTGVNVVNLSFGLFDPAGTNVDAANYSLGSSLWDSLVDEAKAGTAVFVKAAGNTNGGTVDGTTRMRLTGIRPELAQDVLNLSLIGADGAIFVGALDGNGTVDNKASIANYSTIAGDTPGIADMFLVVGVDSDLTGLAGTSFAAPIVSGYAAIVGDKFETATPATVVDQLLLTARKDTIAGYSFNVHGQGEACLSCALSPTSIPD